MKKIVAICISFVFAFALVSIVLAAPPVCPAPTQGYEITGCFADANGDEWAHGGSILVYDDAFSEQWTEVFTNGTFLIDVFVAGTSPVAPPAGYNCTGTDYFVMVTFNNGGAGTPAPQTFCIDGDTTVNGGGYDLTIDNGGNPYSTGTGPLAVTLRQFAVTYTNVIGIVVFTFLLVTLTAASFWYRRPTLPKL